MLPTDWTLVQWIIYVGISPLGLVPYLFGPYFYRVIVPEIGEKKIYPKLFKFVGGVGVMLSKKSWPPPAPRSTVTCTALKVSKAEWMHRSGAKWAAMEKKSEKKEKVKEKEKFRCADLRPYCPRTEDCAAICAQGKLYFLQAMFNSKKEVGH